MSGESADPRVLVVDDERRVAETYRLGLQDEYEVDIATGGEEALEIIDDRYDVVLLDRRMPDLSGDEVLERIEDRDIDCQTVMVTAVQPDPSVLELQCTDYVVKPVESPELKDIVDRALRIGEYSERRRRLGSKKLKRNVLEVEMSDHELEESDEYERLNAEIERLEADVDSLEDELGIEDVDRFL